MQNRQMARDRFRVTDVPIPHKRFNGHVVNMACGNARTEHEAMSARAFGTWLDARRSRIRLRRNLLDERTGPEAIDEDRRAPLEGACIVEAVGADIVARPIRKAHVKGRKHAFMIREMLGLRNGDDRELRTSDMLCWSIKAERKTEVTAGRSQLPDRKMRHSGKLQGYEACDVVSLLGGKFKDLQGLRKMNGRFAAHVLDGPVAEQHRKSVWLYRRPRRALSQFQRAPPMDRYPGFSKRQPPLRPQELRARPVLRRPHAPSAIQSSKGRHRPYIWRQIHRTG
jgi:hypothetical protein